MIDKDQGMDSFTKFEENYFKTWLCFGNITDEYPQVYNQW